jgi:hypothetical protein
MVALPEMDAHSPELVMKPMLTEESSLRSSVLPDSVLVWKRRSKPFPSCYLSASHSLPAAVLWLTLAARAIALDASKSLSATCVVKRQNLVLSMNLRRSSTFSLRPALSWFFAVYGSAFFEPVSALLKPEDMVFFWIRVTVGG